MDAFDKLAREILTEIWGTLFQADGEREQLAALLRARFGPLVEELKAYPEWIEEDGWLVCPRCLSFKQWGHAPDCPRQLALAAFENVTPEKP